MSSTELPGGTSESRLSPRLQYTIYCNAKEQTKHSRHSDYATECTTQGSNPRRAGRIFSSPQRPGPTLTYQWNPRGYAGSRVPTGRVYHAGQVKGDGRKRKGIP
jgi:hypothetical protein